METMDEAVRARVAAFRSDFDHIVANVASVVKGKAVVCRLAVTCMLADGHLLIEDVPGVGKTSLARALAETIDATLQRRCDLRINTNVPSRLFLT